MFGKQTCIGRRLGYWINTKRAINNTKMNARVIHFRALLVIRLNSMACLPRNKAIWDHLRSQRQQMNSNGFYISRRTSLCIQMGGQLPHSSRSISYIKHFCRVKRAVTCLSCQQLINRIQTLAYFLCFIPKWSLQFVLKRLITTFS